MSPSLFRGWRASGGWQFAAILAAPLVFGCSPPSDPAGPWRPPEPEPIRLAFDGTVLGADGVPPEQRLAEDVHVTMTPTVVTAGGETLVGAEVAVQLAPGWFLDERGLRFERNNELHVEGAYRREGGKIVVIASRVGKKGTPVVQLRDEQGKPLWPETPEAAPSGSSTWPIEPTPK